MKIEEAIRQTKFESAYQKVWLNLLYTFNFLNDKLGNHFKDFGLTQQQYNVLRILKGKFPDSISCACVKEVMLDKNPDLTRLCDRLLTKGYIQRDPDDSNRRQVNLKITKVGLDIIKQIEPVIKKNVKLLHTISEEEAKQLSDLLDKLRG